MIWFSAAMIVFVLALFVVAWVWRRAVFLYPSTMMLALSTLIYMVPALAFIDEIEDLSPYTMTALLYCSTFVAVGMLWNLLFAPMPRIENVLSPLPAPGGPAARANRWILWCVLATLGGITLWYLMYVPLRSTGLYGVLFDPANSAELREESLKLIPNAALHYVYLIGFSALSPFAFALLLARVRETHGLAAWAVWLSAAAFLVFYLLITGARVGLVNLTVVALLFGFLRRRLKPGMKPVLAAVVVMFAVPILLSILREQGRNEATLVEYIVAIGERVFLLPLLISGWFVEYAETHGYVGLLGALGVDGSVNWSNLIALEFLGRREAITIESVTTPTSYFFSNYLHFGWLGLLPSWIGLKLIDVPVRWAVRSPRGMREALLAALLFFAVIYVQSGFGVAVISHGYVVLAAIAFLVAQRARGTPATGGPRVAGDAGGAY